MSEANLAAGATSTATHVPVDLGVWGAAGAFIVLATLAALAATVIVLIWRGKIDLSKLLSEEGGAASMSRFQLLVFTFVIATGMVVGLVRCGNFPTLSKETLVLLGISAGSYLGAKIPQKAAEVRQAKEARKAKQAEAGE